ncbi:MAG: aminomethyl-transferring glycine dehydrogenase subunit GcvPA [Pirellulales bacterium]|nr:aminomethyl-transferring glycine dehydrogenase subunit GcvPA [Pirellulales bacterium]
MAYFLNTEDDRRAMLETIGVRSIEELFAMVPDELRLKRALDLPPALSELELTSHLAELAGANRSATDAVCFLGGGCYDHFVPAVVDAIGSRSEFYTSYTPYQPEASQGNLQAFFEYQTLITQLTGMDVSNASLYDGGSAATEGVLMALSTSRQKGRVVTSAGVHPEYRAILRTYLQNLGVELVTVGTPTGTLTPSDLAAALDQNTACVLLAQPNFFGCVEDTAELVRVAHEVGAAAVVAVDPLSLGVLKRPGDYGADIVVAEGQSLGTPMSFGGPFLGILACREQFLRKMPGRVTGQTVDRRGRRCWVLTLQTREQHIRREKATSNICTNQGLFALRATVYLSLLGPHGLRALGSLCLNKSRDAIERITSGERFSLAFDRPTFKEFVLRDAQGRVADLLAEAADEGVFAGVPLGQWYPEMSDCFLVAVTEQRTRAQIDRLATTLAQATRETAPAHA